MLFIHYNKSSPLNSTHHATTYPQNGDRIVAIDPVTALHPIYGMLSLQHDQTRQSRKWRLLLPPPPLLMCATAAWSYHDDTRLYTHVNIYLPS